MRRSLGWIVPVYAFLVAAPLRAHAQTSGDPPTISTDRPGQATSPAIVPPGYVQLEVGAHSTSARTSVDQMEMLVRTASIPHALVRVGVLTTMELRLSTEYRITRQDPALAAGSSGESGMAGLGVGTKVGVTAEHGAIPEAALLLTLALPVGKESFRSRSVAPGFILATRSGLSTTINLYCNLGGIWDGTNGPGYALYNVLVSVSLTNRLGIFGEMYGTLATAFPPAHAADAGLSFLLGENLQIDIFGGAGITGNVPDYLVAGGICIRLPR